MIIVKLLASKARYNVLTPALALSLVTAPVLAAEVTTPTTDYVITNPNSSLTNSSSITRVSSGDSAVAASVDVETIYNTLDGQIIGGARGGILINGTLNTLTNAGLITGSGDGLHVSGRMTNFSNMGTITVGNYGLFVGGNLTNFSNTNTITSGSFGAYVSGNLATFSNSGTISAGDHAVFVTETLGNFNNSGTISTTGAYSVIAVKDIITFNNSGSLSATGYVVYAVENLTTFNNSGTISGGTHGLFVVDDLTTFTNTGAISGKSAGVTVIGNAGTFNNMSSISGGLEGVRFTFDVANFSNTGTISGANYGIHNSGNAGNFSNAGTISSENDGIYFLGTVGSFDNTGTISGARGVYHKNGSGMTLVNSGAIIGTGGTAVDFGAGNDTLQLGTGAAFTGMVDFDAGTNTFDFANYQGNMVLTYATTGTLSNVAGDNFFHTNGTDTVFIVDRESVTQVPFALSDMSAGISELVERGLSIASTVQQPTALGYAATQPTNAAATAIEQAATQPQAQIWGAATFGGSGGIDSQARSAIYGALVAGTHAEFSSELTLGFMAGLGRSRTDSNLPTNTQVNAAIGFLGIYGEQTLDDVTLDFQILGGISTNISDRDINTATGTITAQGEYHGWFLAPQIGVTTNIATLDDGTSVDLSGKIGAIIGGQEGYTETGAVGALTVGSQTFGILNASLELDTKIDLRQTEFGALVGTTMVGIFAQAGFGGETDISIFDATNTAISLGTTSTTTKKTVGIKAGLGLEMPLTPDIDFSGSVSGQFASDGRFSAVAHIGLSGKF